MKTFQKLFGIDESRIKNTCIIMPILKKGILNSLGVKGFSKGVLYSSGNSKSFTVVNTGIGAGLSGDAVLHLSKTECRNIILFGSCGLIKEEKDLEVGSLVTPTKSYALESFSDMLLDEEINKSFSGSEILLEKFLKTNNIKKTTCATLASLKLEEDYISRFTKRNIQVVDMECSCVFSASKHISRNAMALFYITDIINKKPFYVDLNYEDKLKLSSSIKSAANILCNFIEENLNS